MDGGRSIREFRVDCKWGYSTPETVCSILGRLLLLAIIAVAVITVAAWDIGKQAATSINVPGSIQVEHVLTFRPCRCVCVFIEQIWI